jgi:hypothetical protein
LWDGEALTARPKFDDSLQASLVNRFVEVVMRAAPIPAERRADVANATDFSVHDGELSFTCGITGSTYELRWDGSLDAAVAFVEEAGEETAWLIKETPHYHWLFSSRTSAWK